MDREAFRWPQQNKALQERAKEHAAELVDYRGLHDAKEYAREQRLAIAEGSDEREFWVWVCVSLQLDF